jgi:methyl-accepting chemotaxis protein
VVPVAEPSDRGVIALSSAVILLVVLTAVGTSAGLLYRTLGAANRINEKADSIAESGRGINIATDSVIQLSRTNEVAESILGSAQPLEGQLTDVVALAQEIANLAVSINGSAGTINATAGTINSTASAIGATAGGINSEAAGILAVAKRIDTDVATINRNLDATIEIARAIKDDTGNILGTAISIHRHAGCIDLKLLGGSGSDGHCQGG